MVSLCSVRQTAEYSDPGSNHSSALILTTHWQYETLYRLVEFSPDFTHLPLP